jgi:hypothetical protein
VNAFHPLNFQGTENQTSLNQNTDSPWNRFSNAVARVMIFYLEKDFFPFKFPLTPSLGPSPPHRLSSFLGKDSPNCVCVCVCVCRRRRRRSPRWGEMVEARLTTSSRFCRTSSSSRHK